MIESLGSFSAEEKEKIQIIHLCGKADYQWLNQQYQRLGLEVRIFSFLKEIGFALKAADLVLARSGAATLAEIFACGRPSILVPYNFAGGHQKANAFYACEKGAALTFNEERLSPSLLKENLLRLMEEQQLREKMAKQALELAKPDATSCLSKEVLNMLGNN
jgi:UDP-N-acetylglucosamine--N-acetylmuramyl-(pentapeptide) pyrophosphoryl-undecaprenol N-acetylglucosamine transferase